MLILASRYPEQAQELMSYQLFIVRHCRKFEYPSWLQYDTEYRQWAAANNSRNWSQIQPQICAYTHLQLMARHPPGAPSARWMGGTTPLIAQAFSRMQPRLHLRLTNPEAFSPGPTGPFHHHTRGRSQAQAYGRIRSLHSVQ